MPQSDSQIIEEIRAGNARRYAVLVDRHKDRAMTVALRLLGNRTEAEEMVQDGFLRAYKNLNQFRGDALFGTWFYRILYNICLTRLRRRKAAPEMIAVDDEKALDAVALDGEEMSLEKHLESEDLRKFLENEIENLPAHFRAAVTLFHVQEMSYEEMAGIMNLPLGTVKTYLFRGRNLLRKRMLARLTKEVKVA